MLVWTNGTIAFSRLAYNLRSNIQHSIVLYAVYVEDVLLDLTVKNKKLVYGVNTVTQLSNIDNKVKYQW